MSVDFPPKESSAMARARELNRTNGKRLTECIASMSQDVERSLQKLKIDGQTTLSFMKKLKVSSGVSSSEVNLEKGETATIKKLMIPAPKMSFAKVDYKKKKLDEISQKLIVSAVSPACEGNPIPVRTVHPWTSSTARVLSQKKPPRIPRPTGRRRHSVGSDDNSSDEEDIAPLQRVKKRAGQKKLKELAKRRSSLPIISESGAPDTKLLLGSRQQKTVIQASLVKLKERRKSTT